MKFLLVLAVALVGVWLWRTHRQTGQKLRRDGPPASPPQLQDMVRCPVCAVHVPKADAVAGQHGFYCSTEHRQGAEG